MKKKINYNGKNEKKNMCRKKKIELGYCPSVLQVVWVMKIVLQYNFSIAEKKA